MTGRFELIPVTVAGAVAAGAMHALFASIKEPLARRLSISEGQLGWLTAGWHLVLLPALLLCGMLVDQFGVEWLLIVGFLLGAFAAAILGMYPRYQVSVAMLLLLSGATASVLTGAVVLMPAAFGPDYPVAALNLGAFFLFLGVLLVPPAVDRLLPSVGFRRTMGAFALASLVPVLAAALTPAEAFPVGQGQDLGRVVLDPVVLLAAATYFLYVPIELTVRNWSSAYLSQEGYSERRAGGWLLAFWISFLAGRLGTAWLVVQTGPSLRVEPWLLLGLVMMVAVGLGNLASAASRYGAGWGLPLIALAMGPILPSLIGIALHRFPNENGTAFAAVYALGNLGALILMPLIGPYARGAAAFRLPLFLAVAAGIAALALALLAR